MNSTNRIVVIRSAPALVGRDLLKSTIMSHINSAFFSFLFKENIIQLMVLLAAVFFIFLRFPVGWCISTVPLTAILVYLSTYGYHLMKSLELATIEPMSCWIAEVYEPYFMTADPQDYKYTIINESEFKEEDFDKSGLKKKVIGIVMVRDHFGPINKLWMYGLSVDSKYQRKGIATTMVKHVYDFTKRRGYDGVELVITDLQNEARLLFLSVGFKLSQIYHKRILGFIPFGMYQMGIPTIYKDYNFVANNEY